MPDPAVGARDQRGLGGVGRRTGRDLQHGLHQLGLDLPRRGVGPLGIFEQGLDGVDELIGAGVDDHQLLFDADRVARPAEVVLHLPRQPTDAYDLGSKP